MKEIMVAYWSGTGNTAAMATILGKGIQDGGATAKVVSVEDIKADDLKDYPVFALGCPSMGNETLTDVVSGSSVKFTSYDTSNSREYVNCARPAIIPDIDKPFLYAIPNNRYGGTRYNSMLRINIETLKTVDDNGGII